MSDKGYMQAYKAAIGEMESLLNERARIDTRIAQLQPAISGLARLCDVAPPPFTAGAVGFTDACHAVLLASDTPLTPKEVRDGLIRMGYDVSGYSNVMASIHAILKRLVESGRAQRISADGQTLYACTVTAESLSAARPLTKGG